MKTKRPWRWRRRIKYQSQLDVGFAAELASVLGADRLRECIQCGTCSATCPLSAYMDYTPRRLIAMTRAGFREDVLSSFTIWVCTSCYSCTVECPKQIPITEIMYALKRMAVAEDTYPKRFTASVMAREFVSSIESRGRSTESWISIKLYLKTNPIELLKHAPLALRLFRHRRMSLRHERVREPARLRHMLELAEELERGQSGGARVSDLAATAKTGAEASA
jgi:quinone-modifying oxidoreductase subunit QmoC